MKGAWKDDTWHTSSRSTANERAQSAFVACMQRTFTASRLSSGGDAFRAMQAREYHAVDLVSMIGACTSLSHCIALLRGHKP